MCSCLPYMEDEIMSNVKDQLKQWIEEHFTGPKEIKEIDMWLILFNVIAVSTSVKIKDYGAIEIEINSDLSNVSEVVGSLLEDKIIIKDSSWREKEVSMLEMMGILEEEEDEYIDSVSNDGRYN